MEIGGPTPGTEHDQLVFANPGNTQVVWNGDLTIALINGFVPQAGQSFALFSFDPDRGRRGLRHLSLSGAAKRTFLAHE